MRKLPTAGPSRQFLLTAIVETFPGTAVQIVQTGSEAAIDLIRFECLYDLSHGDAGLNSLIMTRCMSKR